MFENMSEQEARQAILDMTAEYCDTFHNQKKPFEEGDRIPYASRVYEMCIRDRYRRTRRCRQYYWQEAWEPDSAA